MRTIAVLVMTAVQLASSPATARERLFVPTDDWSVHAAGEHCRLTRNFADARAERIRLQLQTFGLMQGFKITMVGDGLPLTSERRGVANFKYRFKPDPDWQESMGATGYVDGVDALTFQGHLATKAETERRSRGEEEDRTAQAWAPYIAARAGEVDALALSYHRTRDDIVLQLGNMAEPHRNLQECARGLLRNWGYDPDDYAKLRSGPKLLNLEKIPEALLVAMRRNGLGHNDSIQFRIDVDERGTQSGCTILHPRRGSEVETLICDTLKETAQFEAAVGESGFAVRAPFISSVVFGVR